MAAAASLVARLSGQVAEFQKSFEDAIRTTSAFEKKYAGVASEVQAHQQRLNKAFQSFSGDNIIRDANELASAITKVGGASKLTAAEQARANATVTEAIAKYNALGQSAPAALQNLARATAQIKAIPNPFSGTDVLKAANDYVAAVGKIGGATKLTEAEQKKVNATVVEAIAKYDALGKTAPTSLQNLAKATAQIKAIPNIFSGSQVISQANDYARAVTAIGGASKLTANEQRNVNAVVTDALAKYKALGQEAPKALRDLANATKEVVAPTTAAQKAMGLLHSTFGQFTLATLAASAIQKTMSLIGDAIRGLFGVMREAVEKSAEFNNAFTGLGSIAAAFGQDIEKVKAAARSLSADGLLPLKDSATSLKNLLSSGFGLDQSVKIIEAFKDSAAFGRQSALSFGDAVRSATEGVKNGNSILVDNAGVTKNLSIILKEAGFQMQDLSDKVKGAAARQALFAGIMRETAAQQGDAAKAANTYTGQLSALKTAYDALLVTWGDAITQNRTVADTLGAVSAALRSLNSDASANKNAFNFVSDSIISLIRAFASLLNAVDVVQIAFNQLVIEGNKVGAVLQQTALGFAKFVENGARLARVLNPAQWENYTHAIDQARDAQLEIELAQGRLENSTLQAKLQQESFSNTLQGLRVKAVELADGLEKTRGQVVELGKTGGTNPLGAVAGGLSAGTEKAKGFALQLKTLTAEIDLAAKNGTTLAEMVDLFGNRASTAAAKAKAWGVTVKESVQQVAQAFDRLDIAKDLEFIRRQMDDVSDAIEKFETDDMQREFKELAKEASDALDEIDDRVQKFQKSQDDLAASMKQRVFELNIPMPFAGGFGAGLNGLGFTTAQLNAFSVFGQKAGEKTAAPFRAAFLRIGQELPQLISRGFEQGGVAGAFAGVAQGASDAFGQVFAAGMERVGDDFSKLKFKEKLAGAGALAAKGFVDGFQSGLQGGGGLNSAVAFGSGFLSGFLTTGNPYAGLAIGAVQLAGSLIGASEKADEAARQLALSQRDLARQFGGIADLKKLAGRANFQVTEDFLGRQHSFTPEESVDIVLNVKGGHGVENFNKAVADLNDSLAKYNERLKAIDAATAGVNARSAIFAKQFEPLVAKRTAAKDSGDTDAARIAGQQIQELAQRTQPEFERIGLFVKDTFAAIVRETGDAIGAINSLAPSFDLLKKGISDFGLTSTAVIDSLVGTFNFVNNEAFKPFFENIAASGQLLKGLFDANALSPETFQAVAADIGQSIQEIVNRGGDMAQALALSAPQLQTLWEAQQRFGGVTDQTTQSILAQAEAQGVVGKQFRDVNERILDVLIAIGDALGAKIPDALKALPGAAQVASDGIAGSFSGALDTVDNRIKATGTELSDGLAARARAAGKEIQTSVGGSLDSLVGRSRSAATDISNNLARIRAPEITIPVEFDFKASTDPRVRFYRDPNDVRDGIPALANGGIVRRPTLALVGEAGPEAVIPLSKLGQGSSGRQSPAPSSIVFREGSVIIQGNVDSDERARQVVRDFAKVVRQGGQLRTLARETLGVE